MISLVDLKNHGQIHIKLKELLKDKEIKRNTLAKAIGTSFDVIDRWCTGSIDKIDTDILSKICCVLECDLIDILEYRKDEKDDD